MLNEPQCVYPSCPTNVRTVDVGGLDKPALIKALKCNEISLNESAEKLFASDLFTTSETQYRLTTVELTVDSLGFRSRVTASEIYGRAHELGLYLCPLELGPHLRLQYRDQPEGYWGKPIRPHQAPIGSITVASEPPSPDPDFPRGFYLRRIKGALWLRGYVCGPEHLWNLDDHLVFTRQAEPAAEPDESSSSNG